MNPKQVGWDRIVGGCLLAVGVVVVVASNQALLGRDATAPGVSPIQRADLYFIALGALLAGWSIPLLLRGQPRKVLAIILGVETPLVLWIAWGMGRVVTR